MHFYFYLFFSSIHFSLPFSIFGAVQATKKSEQFIDLLDEIDPMPPTNLKIVDVTCVTSVPY